MQSRQSAAHLRPVDDVKQDAPAAGGDGERFRVLAVSDAIRRRRFPQAASASCASESLSRSAWAHARRLSNRPAPTSITSARARWTHETFEWCAAS